MESISDPHVELMYTPSKNFFPRHKVKVLLDSKFDRKPLPSEYEKTIEGIWAERVAANPKLWNGTKFRIDSANDQDNEPLFLLGITDYKEFICTNWSPNANIYHQLGIQNYSNKQAHMSDALGVGSLVETKDNCMIFLRRSMDCGEAQGLWDIPGGHPEPQELVGKMPKTDIDATLFKQEDVVKEIFDSTLREIVDEVNVPVETLTDPLLMGIARNTTSAGRPSSEYYVQCSLPSAEIKQRYNKGGHAEADESTGITFVPMNQVEELQKHSIWQDMAPSAKGCVILYQTAKLKARLSLV